MFKRMSIAPFNPLSPPPRRRAVRPVTMEEEPAPAPTPTPGPGGIINASNLSSNPLPIPSRSHSPPTIASCKSVAGSRSVTHVAALKFKLTLPRSLAALE